VGRPRVPDRRDRPALELASDDGLGATQWYRNQPPDVRARIGLHLIAANMKAGLQFESILKRGLLEYAFLLPTTARSSVTRTTRSSRRPSTR